MSPALYDFNGASVRVIQNDFGIWFAASDVCRVLEIANSRDAVSGLAADEKGVVITDTPGGSQQINVINESGLYCLIFKSRKPQAQEFRKWVTSEVLPAIRQTGTYTLPFSQFQIPTTLADALQLAADQARQIEQKDKELAKAAPKLRVYDQLASADGLFNFRQVTAMLPSLGMGSNNFVKKLIADKVLFRDAKGRIGAHRQHIDAGRFRGKESVYELTATGESRVSVQIMVTQTGLEWLAEKYNVKIVDGGEEAA